MRQLYVQLPGGQNRYGLVYAVMINPSEMATQLENNAHIASTGVRLF